jgi:predicted small secreted protein
MRNLMLPFAIALVTAAAITGCNTVEGVGKDLKAAGQKIEGAASKKDDKKDAGAAPERSSEKY